MHHILLSFVDIDKSVDGFFVNICCRTPCGVRGLKYDRRSYPGRGPGRTPCGVRGLKSRLHRSSPEASESHPLRGAWIEMSAPRYRREGDYVAPPAGCVD